jgi:nucleoside-diphosphate-sugar epimerase
VAARPQPVVSAPPVAKREGTPGLVLVTGAGGRLGRCVLAACAEQGIATRALVLARDMAMNMSADHAVIGDARDPDAVRRALVDVDAVVHLAAIASPAGGTAEEVFCGNTAATFTVLEQAAAANVGRVVIASSHSATGLPFSVRPRTPAYVPIDEHIPLQVEDPYALSKQVDELTASMMWWRHGLDVVALRFPFLGDVDDRLPRRAQQFAAEPAKGAAELWGYLDYRDAAETCLAALRQRRPGCHVVTVAAPTTLAPYPTEQLLDAFLPDVPRRTRFPGRTAPFDLSRARDLLGFAPRFLWPIDERELAVPST